MTIKHNLLLYSKKIVLLHKSVVLIKLVLVKISIKNNHHNILEKYLCCLENIFYNVVL
jgi:hypothetical protein